MCSTCRKHFLVLSSFLTYHRVCNQINTTGVTCGAGITYPSGAHEFTFVLLDLQFYVYALQIVVYPFVIFRLAIVLSVLRFTDSDYSFGILDLRILITPLVSSNFSYTPSRQHSAQLYQLMSCHLIYCMTIFSTHKLSMFNDFCLRKYSVSPFS